MGDTWLPLLELTVSLSLQAYTIQGQYAIPHPDVSFYSVPSPLFSSPLPSYLHAAVHRY